MLDLVDLVDLDAVPALNSLIYAWKNGRVLQPSGYVRIKRCGPWRDWYEHRAIWCEMSSSLFVPLGFDVHHQNRVQWDNDPNNLSLMSHKEHMAESARHRHSGDGAITIYNSMTEELYDALIARGVSVPASLMEGIEWWEQREASYKEVPF